MEKRVVLAIVICLGLWLGYSFWLMPRPTPPGSVRTGTAVSVRTGTGATPPAPAPTPAPAPPPQAPPSPAPQAPESPLVTEVLEAGRKKLVVSSRGGGTIEGIELWTCPYHGPGERAGTDPGAPMGLPNAKPRSLSVDVTDGPGATGAATRSWAMTREKTDAGDGVRAETTASGVRIVRTLLPAGEHDWTVEIAVSAAGAKPGEGRILKLVGPWTPAPHGLIPEDGLLIHQEEEGLRHLLAAAAVEEIREGNGETSPVKAWNWIGVHHDFHFAGLAPKQPLPSGTTVALEADFLASPPGSPEGAAPTPVQMNPLTAAAAFRIPFTVPAEGETTVWRFMLFTGPCSEKLLRNAPYDGFSDALANRKFLIFSFGPVARGLSWLLQRIADTGMGWGLAVCALTVLVRGLLFPLSKKSQVSMRLHAAKMARVKPKMDAIKEKWKDNPQRQQAETMSLMKQEKLSILPGGCLIAFLQMPVWISLYGIFQTTFEMRHAGFLWIEDLTAPDRLAALPFWPGEFNLLPLLMTATWYISAAMTPLPDDPEQRMQAKIMRFIPVLFGVFMYSTAAGLTLYMTLSALWSIGETWLIKKVWLSKLDLGPVPAAAAAGPVRK